MIPAVADIDARLAAAGALRLDRVRLQVPVRDVDHVDVLLDDDVAGQRLVEDPVAQARRRGALRGLRLQAAGVVVDVPEHRRADVAAMHARGRFAKERVAARLEVHEHVARRPCGFDGTLDREAAGHVDRDRLGQVEVLAGLQHGNRLLGMEVRRAFDGHGIELADRRDACSRPGP